MKITKLTKSNVLHSVKDSLEEIVSTDSKKVNKLIHIYSDGNNWLIKDRVEKANKYISKTNFTSDELDHVKKIHQKFSTNYAKRIGKFTKFELDEIKDISVSNPRISTQMTDYRASIFTKQMETKWDLAHRIKESNLKIENRYIKNRNSSFPKSFVKKVKSNYNIIIPSIKNNIISKLKNINTSYVNFKKYNSKYESYGFTKSGVIVVGLCLFSYFLNNYYYDSNVIDSKSSHPSYHIANSSIPKFNFKIKSITFPFEKQSSYGFNNFVQTKINNNNNNNNNIKRIDEPKYIIRKKEIDLASINGQTVIKQEEWVLKINNHNSKVKNAVEFVNNYYEISNEYGINPSIALTQAMLETGWLKYGGDVNNNQNNFCGLGATGNGVRGHSFSTIRDGVEAHIQHLFAYSSKKPLVKPLLDPRFKLVQRGISPTVDGLTNRWASDDLYSKKIRSILEKFIDIS